MSHTFSPPECGGHDQLAAKQLALIAQLQTWVLKSAYRTAGQSRQPIETVHSFPRPLPQDIRQDTELSAELKQTDADGLAMT